MQALDLQIHKSNDTSFKRRGDHIVNLIVIMEDSFRYDHLGCSGNSWIKTPNIDRLASQGVIFDHAYAEGLPTIPARVALFTGRYTLPFRGWQPLEQADIPFTEVLWDKGYTTALISDTPHMHKPTMGFSRGFDYVEWIRGQETDKCFVDPDVKIYPEKYSDKNWYPSYPGYPRERLKKMFEEYLRNNAHWKNEEHQFVAQVMKAGMAWLERQVSIGKKDRLVLWLDSFDPHEPWDPPSPYKEMYAVSEYTGLPITLGGGLVNEWSLAEIRHVRAQYAGKISMADKWTGIFLEKVSDLGLLDNTMVIFLSDHGEPLGEHGIVKKVRPWSYEELAHIPLIIRLPDGGKRGRHVETFVSTPDIMPTILDFLNVKGPPVMQGRSLLPSIEGDDGMKFGISGYHNRCWSIRDKEWSYHFWLGGVSIEFATLQKDIKERPELYKLDTSYRPPEPSKYELEKDQAERDDRYDVEIETPENLENKLKDFIGHLKPSSGDLMAQTYVQRLSARQPSKASA
jgi:arylsulfatase A-like enzyme